MTDVLGVSHDVISRAKHDLAAAFRAAAMHGFNEGIDNHFSLAVPGRTDLFLLNRFGPHWSEMTSDDIITVDFDGNVVDGHGHWEVTAFMIHRGCHRARPDAQAVFHTHMPYASALSMTADGLNTRIHQNSMYFHNRMARLSYGGFAEGPSEGDRIASAVTDGAILVMLDNHGVIVIGADVADAWHKLYFLEQAARLQVLAKSTGSPLIEVSEEVAQMTADSWHREAENAPQLFAAVKRQLGWLDIDLD
jgi:ribulose-5-phosphate 4-epimerase/fuculose-1-phosphate aldolase